MSPLAQAIVYIAAIVALLLLSAFFSCADMVYSVAPVRLLEKKNTKSAKKAAYLARNYDKTIIGILFGNNLANILASSLAAALTRVDLPLFRANPDASSAVVELILLLFILIFGEIMPKIIAKAYSFRLAQLFATPITFFSTLFIPFVVPTGALAHVMTKPIFVKLDTSEEGPSNEELQAMVDVIEEEGFIDRDQSEMIASAIEFKDTCAYEIMTPRVKIEGIEVRESLSKFVRSGRMLHSRIIVYKDNLDNILGYIPLKQVQKALLRDGGARITDWMVPILAVPGTMEISMILKRMKQSRHHIVLVKDEYGGNDGILTMEDILEELVGEMFDESEPVKEEIERTDKRNVYVVKGSIHIEDFFEYFHVEEDELSEDVETLSGWLNAKLGRFAKEGDMVTVGKVDVVVKKATPYITEEAMVYYHPRRKVDKA